MGTVGALPTGQQDGYFEGPPLEAGHEHAQHAEPCDDAPLLQTTSAPPYSNTAYDVYLLRELQLIEMNFARNNITHSLNTENENEVHIMYP